MQTYLVPTNCRHRLFTAASRVADFERLSVNCEQALEAVPKFSAESINVVGSACAHRKCKVTRHTSCRLPDNDVLVPQSHRSAAGIDQTLNSSCVLQRQLGLQDVVIDPLRSQLDAELHQLTLD